MLETLFIWCLILIPLGIAVILIAYRARFFVVGVIGIVTLMMLVWAGLWVADRFGGDDADHPADIEVGGAMMPSDLSFDREPGIDRRSTSA